MQQRLWKRGRGEEGEGACLVDWLVPVDGLTFRTRMHTTMNGAHRAAGFAHRPPSRLALLATPCIPPLHLEAGMYVTDQNKTT